MTETGIFKYIWRINAVLVLLVGLGMSYYLIDGAFDGIKSKRRHASSRDVSHDKSLQLGRAQLVGNGKYYLYELRPGGDSRPPDLRHGEAIRNFLIVNAETNESAWMFPDSTHYIVSWSEIRKDVDCGYESVGFELCDVREDTNGDGMRDDHDKAHNLVAAGFDHSPKDLLGEAVTGFRCEENDGKLFCQFSSEKGHESAVFMLDAGTTLINRAVLPDAPEMTGEG